MTHLYLDNVTFLTILNVSGGPESSEFKANFTETALYLEFIPSSWKLE